MAYLPESVDQQGPSSNLGAIIECLLRQRVHTSPAIQAMAEYRSNDKFTNDGAFTVFTHVHHTATSVGMMGDAWNSLTVIQRVLGWEIARSLITINDWYMRTGPELAHGLISIYQTEGPDKLSSEYPTFSGLICDIMTYIKALHASKEPQTKARNKKRKRARKADGDDNSAYCFREVSEAALEKLQGGKATKRQLLPIIEPHSIGSSDASQLDFGSRCFVQYISDVFIQPHLPTLDDALSGVRKGRPEKPKDSTKLDDYSSVVMRTVIRGALVDLIVEECGRDDAIFASLEVAALLRSPAGLWTKADGKRTEDKKIFSKLIKDPANTLNPLRSWIKSFINAHPSIPTLSKQLGDRLYQLLTDRHGDKPWPRYNPLLHMVPARRPRSCRRTAKSDTKTLLPFTPLTTDKLLPDSTANPFSPFMAIVHEGLLRRKYRGKPGIRPSIGDVRISRLMDCLHPTTGNGATDQDVDHFDPIRFDNQYARLLQQHFTYERITSPHGLSNLLVWMSTGQGFVTKDFIHGTLGWFSTSHECIALFRSALAAQKQGGYQCENKRIWGQPSAWFGAEGKKFTIEEKFDPLFTTEVLEAWTAFLGNRTDQSRSQAIPKYSAALKLLKDLGSKVKLRGFKDGLTNLQFANNLVALGLCHPPTIEELGHWIYKHPDKGAFKGLVLLGFEIQNRPMAWTQAALQCLHDHLQATLSPNDVKTLHFGTIFVEHVLCKVSRFNVLIIRGSKSKWTLRNVATDSAARAASPGATDTFPAPVAPPRTTLDHSVAQWA